MDSSFCTLTVCFGSQTGCAESIAKRVFQEAQQRHFDVELMELDAFHKSAVWERENHHVIVICSTTGNGDPPENAIRFWRFIKRRSQPKELLQKLKFTVLGLGDTNYDQFCYMGKSINKRFKELGATCFYELGTADEATGLEDVVEPWLDKLWPAVFESTGMEPPAAEPIKNFVASASASTTSTCTDTSVGTNDINGNSTLPITATTASSNELPATDQFKLLPEHLVTFEQMFGCLCDEAPQDLPRFQDSLFTVTLTDAGLQNNAPEQEATSCQESGEDHSMESPFMARVVSAQYLTSPAAEKQVIAVELDISGSNIQYIPGDAIGVKCPNREEDVDALLARLQLDGNKTFLLEPRQVKTIRSRHSAPSGANLASRFPAGCTVREALLRHVDLLSVPKKAVLRVLAHYCTDSKEQATLLTLSSKSGADKYKAFIEAQQVNIVELLHLFASCKLPLDHLLSLLPSLMPRYYSIASSPLVNANRLRIALTVVKNQLGDHGLERRGLCSNWIQCVCHSFLDKSQQVVAKAVELPIFLRKARDFRLPDNRKKPLILIGPGTGVAPFIGFLQHREIQAKESSTATTRDPIGENGGEIHMFFGCRTRQNDWLFQDEMEHLLATGTLTSLFTAFSRDQETKHYVQHELESHSQLVCDLLLQQDAFLFLCGDGAQMARDVQEALINVLRAGAHQTKEQAQELLGSLAANGRYVRDIW